MEGRKRALHMKKALGFLFGPLGEDDAFYTMHVFEKP